MKLLPTVVVLSCSYYVFIILQTVAEAVPTPKLNAKTDAWRTESGLRTSTAIKFQIFYFIFKSFLQTPPGNEDWKHSANSQCFSIPKWSCSRSLVTVRKWFHFVKPTKDSTSGIPVNDSQIQPTTFYCSFPQPQHGNCSTVEFVSRYLLLNTKGNYKREACGGKLGISHIKHLGFHLDIWPWHRSTFGLSTYFSDSVMTPLSLFSLFCLRYSCLFPVCCVMKWHRA